MFNLKNVPNDVFIPGASGFLPGYESTEGHPYLTPVMDYRFNRDLLNDLAQSWVREQSRPDTAPRRGLWLSGPKGSGKTTAIGQFFARLGVPLVEITCNKHFTVQDVVQSKALTPTFRTLLDGSKEPVGVTTRPVDGPLAIAMRAGLPVVFNELDLADPGELTGMNDIVDRGLFIVPDTGEVIRAARGFCVYVASNGNGNGDLTGEYGGINVMNTSLMRRFLKVRVDYMPEAEEVEAVKSAMAWKLKPLAADMRSGFELVIQQACKAATAIRSAYLARDKGLPSPISTSEVIDWCECMLTYDSLSQRGVKVHLHALDRAYVNGLPEECREAVYQLVNAVMSP